MMRTTPVTGSAVNKPLKFVFDETFIAVVLAGATLGVTRLLLPPRSSETFGYVPRVGRGGAGVQVPSRTVRLFDPLLAAAISCRPSPLKSPTAAAKGVVPALNTRVAPNVPLPLPRIIERLFVTSLADRTSWCPSPLKSPTTTARGCWVAESWAEFENPPKPLPVRIVILFEKYPAVARSGIPSSLKSPIPSEIGRVLVLLSAPNPKTPLPLFRLTPTALPEASVAAISRSLSMSKLAISTDV